MFCVTIPSAAAPFPTLIILVGSSSNSLTSTNAFDTKNCLKSLPNSLPQRAPADAIISLHNSESIVSRSSAEPTAL